MSYKCIHKKFGTILYLKGGDLLVSLSWALGCQGRKESNEELDQPRQFYILCLLVYCTNSNKPTPMHILMADAVEMHGGSRVLIKLLNQFGIVASSDTHDRFVTTIAELQRKKSLWDILPSTVLTIASADNFDMLQRHAAVYCGDQHRSYHGTTLQLVQPYPKLYLEQRKATTTFSSAAPMDLPLSSLSAHLGATVDRPLPSFSANLGATVNPPLPSLSANLGATGATVDPPLPSLSANLGATGAAVDPPPLSLSANLGATGAAVNPPPLSLSANFGARVDPPPLSLSANLGARVDSPLPSLSANLGATVDPPPPSLSAQKGKRRQPLQRSPVAIANKRPRTVAIKNVLDVNPRTSDNHTSVSKSTTQAFPFTTLTMKGFEENQEEQKERESTQHYLFNLMMSRCALNATNEHNKTLKNFKDIYAMDVHDADMLSPSTIHYMEIIDENPDNNDTMRHIAELLIEKTASIHQDNYVILVGDGKTYDHLIQIKNLYGAELQQLLIFPGDWHTMANYQPVLMKAYYHAGLKELAMSSGHRGETLKSLEKCSHFKRTHNFLIQAWQALYQQMLNAYVNKNSLFQLTQHLKVTLLNEEIPPMELMKQIASILDEQNHYQYFQSFVKTRSDQDDTCHGNFGLNLFFRIVWAISDYT